MNLAQKFEIGLAIIMALCTLVYGPKMNSGERIGLWLVTLCATLAIFLEGWPHHILVAGYIALIGASSFYDQIYPAMEKQTIPICLLFIVGTLGIMMLLDGPLTNTICSAGLFMFGVAAICGWIERASSKMARQATKSISAHT